MSFPDLTVSELETRVRTYLSEVTPSFYTQAEIWRWLSLSAKDIGQECLVPRRVLEVDTANGVRTVTTHVYKVTHVEYVPSSGRSLNLPKIDPLKTSHYPIDGVTPQYWYEHGDSIGIEPLPNATYRLLLYVIDFPKVVVPISIFS
jgi:hypothetical protein